MAITTRTSNPQCHVHSFVWIAICLVVQLKAAEQGENYNADVENADASYFFYQQSQFPRDCKEIRDQCAFGNSTGIHLIKPDTFVEPFEAYCDNSEDGGGWTVIQRRNNNESVEFNRNWESYRLGFGFLSHEFYLGNEKISYLTNQKNYELMLEITTTNGSTFKESYMNFRIGDEFSNYKLVRLEKNSGTLFQFSHFTDCQDAYNSGLTDNGIYQIKPTGWTGSTFYVYCNMTDGGGWTVIQRRVNGSFDFYLGWDSYKEGFGNVNHEFWLGNGKLYFLTSRRRQELKINLVNRNGAPYYARFDNFRINDESDNYRLVELGTYSGTAGDALTYHLNYQFTTYDNDNDAYGSNCAVTWHGAWWYYNCHYSSLNGDYFGPRDSHRSIDWYNLPGSRFNVKYTEMRIRPVE